jgi:hypothetical protein
MTRVALGSRRQSDSFPLGRSQPLLKCQERFILVFLLAGQSENCFVTLPQTQKPQKGLPLRLLFEVPAMTYSPTKFPWQYHRR